MVNLKKLKLNQITNSNLENREMHSVLGGMDCGCPCYYASAPSRSGGSSTDGNSNANHEHGYNPGYACNKECWGSGMDGAVSVYLSHGDSAASGGGA